MDGSSDSRTRATAAAPPVHEFVPGEKIGRYLLLEQVGQGGMGVVFAAFDPQLNRKVALKILRASHAEHDDKRQLRARLLREAQAIAKLSHPNVITVFDVGTVGASVFVAMEFVEGVTLSEYLSQPRTLEAIIGAFAQAGRGLSAAHEAGLVHRDFKPDNVLMGFDHIARVSDFGLARSDPSLVVDEDDEEPELLSEPGEVVDADLLSSPMTQAGAVVGTPRYMAPEQHAGAPPDPRSDQFAFCVALYQALYGREPFVAHTMERLVHLKQQGRIMEPPEGVRVPGQLEQLIWRGLSPDPRRRYATMALLLEDLDCEPEGAPRPFLRWGVGVGLSVVALGIAALQTGGDEPSVCSVGKMRWREVWNDTRKQAIRASFERATPGAPEVSYAAVERGLDAYGDAFAEQYALACDAVKGPRPEDDTIFGLRQSCLMERRDDVVALVELFDSADPALVRAAPHAVAELPRVERCAEVGSLLSRGMPTPSEGAPAAVEFRSAMMQARVLGLAGKYEASLGRARAALEQAESLGVGTLLTEAHLALGRALALSGRYPEAETHLTEAVLGGTRSAHDEAAASAAIALVEVVGVRLDRHAEGVMWEAQAGALLDRLGENGILRARLENRAGRLDAQAGDHEAARAHYLEALSLRSTARGQNDPGRADWLIDLGNLALARGRFDEAVETFDRALALAEATLTPSHPTRAAALAAIGRVHLRREEYGPAHAALLEAESGLQASLGVEHPSTALVLLDLAAADEGLGNRGDASVGYARAAELLASSFGRGHASYRSALLGQSRCARRDGELGDARAWFERACRGPGLPASLDGPCLIEQAGLELADDRLDEAASAYAKAAIRFEDGASEDPRGLAEALVGLASTQALQGRHVAASRTLQDARAAIGEVRGYVPSVRNEVDALATRLARAEVSAERSEPPPTRDVPRTVPAG